MTGVVSEAEHPPGKFGDGAGLKTADLPVTARRTLTPTELSELREIAAKVWREGATSAPPSLGPAPSRKQLSAGAYKREMQRRRRILDAAFRKSLSCITVDAIGQFQFTKNGVIKTEDFSIPCMSADASRLLKALHCGVRPDEKHCKEH